MRILEKSILETVHGGQNCAGIYHACVNVAAITGGAIVVGTAGWGVVFGVLLGSAGMELCRQQYLGCR